MDRKAFEIHDLDNRELPVLYHPGGNGTISNWHENLEILYCTAGKGLLVCGGVEHTMLPGHLYACNSNEMHAAFDQGALKYDCLIVDMQFLKLNAIHSEKRLILTYNRVFRLGHYLYQRVAVHTL